MNHLLRHLLFPLLLLYLYISLINHPGDYGHHLYFLMLKELLDRAVWSDLNQKHIYKEEKE